MVLYVCGVYSHRVDVYLSPVCVAGRCWQGGHVCAACWAACECADGDAHRFFRRRLVCWMRPLAFFDSSRRRVCSPGIQGMATALPGGACTPVCGRPR